MLKEKKTSSVGKVVVQTSAKNWTQKSHQNQHQDHHRNCYLNLSGVVNVRLPGSNGYIFIEANGGLNQHGVSSCNAVAVAGLFECNSGHSKLPFP